MKLLVIISMAVLGGTACVLLNRMSDAEKLDSRYAKIILKNLAAGMRTYSAANGGGGETSFSGDKNAFRKYVTEEAYAAVIGKNFIPYHGYEIELEENPIGDRYETNFRFVARPTKGKTGESFSVDKSEDVILFKE